MRTTIWRISPGKECARAHEKNFKGGLTSLIESLA
jgi:hypothetical protein